MEQPRALLWGGRAGDAEHSGGSAPAKDVAEARRGPALDIKKGDKILFGKYAGSEVKVNGTEYLIMREEDVLGVVED